MAPPASPDVRYASAEADALRADAELAALYPGLFPAAEREPLDVIWRSVAAGSGLVLRARAGEHTIGFITLHLVAEPAIAFVVYLGIATGWQGRGIGSALFEHGWREASRRADDAGRPLVGCAWEIDPPLETLDPVEQRRRASRLKFFHALGGRVLSKAYLQPPVNGPEPVPMWLMIREAPGRPPLSATDVVAGIYFEKYGGANGLDRAMLGRLLAQVRAAAASSELT